MAAAKLIPRNANSPWTRRRMPVTSLEQCSRETLVQLLAWSTRGGWH
jgi:hypothetical protein